MLVYGERRRTVDPAAVARGLADEIEALAGLPPGIVRHGRLVAALVDAGELVQGLADATAEAAGADGDAPAAEAAMAVLLALARAVLLSWESRFAALPPLDAALLRDLPDLPAEIRPKRGEGFAYYALYPEAYAEAARALAPAPGTTVVGLRSIGTALAAMVAAALGAPAPLTLRPVGHPFERRLAVSPGLEARLLAGRGDYAIVDEGPGLSGSSFGGVADFLEDRGVAPERVHFFPSHEGTPGPQARPRHLARWAATRRHVVGFDALVRQAPDPAHRLEAWVTDLCGRATEPLHDLSGGAWRPLHYGSESEWPAALAHQERRKFLLRTAGGSWLLKFAGLGTAAQGAAALAQRLSRAGLTPDFVGYRHGFLVERWHEEARPLDPASFPRADLLHALGRTLAARAGEGATAPLSGASLAELAAMARHNAGEALGPEVARGLDLEPPVSEEALCRVRTDNRLHRHEWLVLPDRRLLKTDAVDHHDAHDLIGCQDIAWDVAGARVEFALDESETAGLARAVEAARGAPIPPALLGFLERAYCAFQLGVHRLGAQALAGWPEEAARLEREVARYGARLVG